ncbi:MAG: DUF4190 domain-containing protein [Ilumatobacter sp.]|uniref:DUF4190 domain-containing protein n=1 Tax=Ilumatobacter sp. TaxID=1967498 RepID=UPI00391922C8
MSETPTTPTESVPIRHPRAMPILVTGILGVTIMPVLGPVAWALGRSTLREIDATTMRYSNRTTVQVGMILGVISTVILVVGLAVVVTIVVWVTTGDGIKQTNHNAFEAFEAFVATAATAAANTGR